MYSVCKLLVSAWLSARNHHSLKFHPFNPGMSPGGRAVTGIFLSSPVATVCYPLQPSLGLGVLSPAPILPHQPEQEAAFFSLLRKFFKGGVVFLMVVVVCCLGAASLKPNPNHFPQNLVVAPSVARVQFCSQQECVRGLRWEHLRVSSIPHFQTTSRTGKGVVS